MGFLVGFHCEDGAGSNTSKEIEEFIEVHLPIAQRKVVIHGSVVVVEMNFGDTFAQKIEPLGQGGLAEQEMVSRIEAEAEVGGVNYNRR